MCKYTDYAEYNGLVDQSSKIKRALIERARTFDPHAEWDTAYRMSKQQPHKFDTQPKDRLIGYDNLGAAYQSIQAQIRASKRKIQKINSAVMKFKGYVRYIQTETAWISIALKLDAKILKEKSMIEINNLLAQISDNDIRATLDLHFPLNPQKSNLDCITVGIMDKCVLP